MKKGLKIILISSLILLLTGCFSNEEKKYSNYIKATMDASYLGDNEEYLKVADTKREDAEELYENTAEYLAYSIMNYYEINYEYLSDDTLEKFIDLAKTALKKSKYNVNAAKKVDGKYQVKIEIDPIDIWTVAKDEVKEYIEEYNEKYSNATTLTEEMEEEYANKIYDILKPHVSKMEYSDSVSKIVEIEFDDDGKYGISDDDWDDIDEYVMGMK